MAGDDAPVETLDEETTTAAQSDSATPSGSSAEMGSALYVAMPRPFVFNVPGSSRDRIVQIKVQLLVRGDVNEETAKKHIPLIEGTLLSVFSTTTADELSTSPKFKSIYSTPSKNELFTCPEDGNENISWKLSDSIYVIVLHEDELMMLQGTNIDTRKKSQRESQKNS